MPAGGWITSRWIASATTPTGPPRFEQIAAAISKTGRPIVLSLSPGPTQLEHAAEVAEYAQMWRITNDHWDGWSLPPKPGGDEFPFGLSGEFDRHGQVVYLCEAGQLAGRGYAALGLAGAASGLGRAAPVAADAGRAADRVHAVGDCALAADSGRESDQAG